ncbi:MAG: ASKHA domain-containing protein, partial [Desulfonatronovibrionaceae bacterium]
GSPLANRVRSQIRKRRLYLNEAIYLDPTDIEELLKVKAAFSLGLDSLLKTAGIPAAGLEKVRIAGALGERLSPAVLTGLGFLPPASEEKINFCGNTSLSGGLKLAADLDRGRLEAHKIRGRVQTVDLTQTRFYTGKEFARHMRFESV